MEWRCEECGAFNSDSRDEKTFGVQVLLCGNCGTAEPQSAKAMYEYLGVIPPPSPQGAEAMSERRYIYKAGEGNDSRYLYRQLIGNRIWELIGDIYSQAGHDATPVAAALNAAEHNAKREELLRDMAKRLLVHIEAFHEGREIACVIEDDALLYRFAALEEEGKDANQ